MKDNNQSIEDIKHIRHIMEQSTTFVSLTGWSGIVTGLIGLITFYLFYRISGSIILNPDNITNIMYNGNTKYELILLALAALSLSLISAFILTLLQGRKKNKSIWNPASKQFAFHLFIPLIAGGFFIVALVRFNSYEFICASMLLFFGLALLNSSKFVKPGMAVLAFAELLLGIAAAFWIPMGVIFWALGFGAAILIYGITMYLKYER